MDEHLQPDEAAELEEYLAAERELNAARALEEAEFIRDEDLAADGLEDDAAEAAGEVQEAPPALIDDAAARRTYWQAHALVEVELAEFAEAVAADDAARQRSAYYRLAVFHGRTIYILRTALSGGKEALAQAAWPEAPRLWRMRIGKRRAPALW